MEHADEQQDGSKNDILSLLDYYKCDMSGSAEFEDGKAGGGDVALGDTKKVVARDGEVGSCEDVLEIEKRFFDRMAVDFADLTADLNLIDRFNCENTSSTCSLSPRAPLAYVDVSEHIIILEAPEEFRCEGEKTVAVLDATEAKCSDVCEPEHVSPFRDHDNSSTTEVGDTCGRAIDKAKSEPLLGDDKKIRDSYTKGEKEEDGGVGECELNLISRDVLLVEKNGGMVDQDNDQVQADYADVVTEDLHVGCSDEVTAPSEQTDSLCAITVCDMHDDNVSDELLLLLLRPSGGADKVVEETKAVPAVTTTKHRGVDVTLVINEELLEQCVSDPGAGDNRCAEGRDAVNGPGISTVSGNIACLCAGNLRTPAAAAAATVKPSIEVGVARCAQAPGCSRVSAAKVCGAALHPDRTGPSSCEQKQTQSQSNALTSEKSDSSSCDEHDPAKTRCPTSSGSCASENCNESESDKVERECDIGGVANLSWGFKGGSLRFDVPSSGDDESERVSDNRLGHSSRPEKPFEQVVANQENANCHSDPHPQPEIRPKNVPVDLNLKSSTESNTNHKGETETENETELLFSRNLNRRVDETRSRLKRLEEKLKEAGITDENITTGESPTRNHFYKPPKASHDANQNILPAENVTSTHKLTDEDTIPENYGIDEIDLQTSAICEFDVRHINTFTTFNDCDYFVVYDELDDTSEDGDADTDDDYDRCLLISTKAMRGDAGGAMGIDGERAVKQHNPDRDNLKSLLKKPGRGREAARKNRVVFNENKNEFFDADYIILIREECDYDEEDDDGVCTCNQHEMVRLTCCEPNCNCNFDGYQQDPTPQSPKFAPPLEFVDAVTLSPPEGYKDMELGEQQLLALQQMARRGQRTAVCRECSATHDDEGDASQSDNEEAGEPNSSDHEEQPAEEKEKTDQSQQTTPTTPPADSECPDNQRYVMETVSMTTVSEQYIREAEDDRKSNASPIVPPGGSPISGILKGGRLWKQQSVETNLAPKYTEPAHTDSSVTSDEEGNTKRSVRFIESSEGDKRDICDGAPSEPSKISESAEKQNSVSPESTEMMLTFKLGNHVLISNNSLKPNSAVRQLFPCTKPLTNKMGEDESIHQYLVTAESLKAFEEAKRSKLPQIIQSGETDDSIKKAIERNTLRRSLIRYEPRSKKNVQKTDNSLVERIKQLTCDVDDVGHEEEIPQRTSPPGEEARNSPEVKTSQDKSFSPSSSSTTSSNSSASSTYKKITDLFAKREKAPDVQNNLLVDANRFVQTGQAPDLGNGDSRPREIEPHCPVSKMNSTTADATRKQFLSTLAPLTACVSGINNVEEYYYMNNTAGERISVASSVGTEYSLEDIDEGLRNDEDDNKRIAPDVLAGTPSASESGDELAMFVQQDASRIERIKKKYQPELNDDEDEHDDYGFNRRPSVRGIKPRFGSTTEILQQIQNQMQPPTTVARIGNQVAWPYYSESGLTGVDNAKARNLNQNMPPYQYSNVPDDKSRSFYYRPTTLVEENIYQNCANQRCARDATTYRSSNVNHVYGSPVMRVGGGCSEYYQSLPRNRTNRPQSPPPLEVSKNYHQTMVYIPYNHIEGYQPAAMSPSNYYTNDPCHRVTNQNQINNRYLEPIYHSQQRSSEEHYQQNVLPLPPKQIRNPYAAPQPHLIPSRSESPLPGQFSTARSTQTPSAVLSTCNYYPRYRPMVGPVWQGDNMYVNKTNRHSFPAAAPRYPPPPDNISLTDSESQHSVQMPNGYRQSVEISFTAQKESPTKPRFIERGVPEGAASVSPQDTSSVLAQSTSTMTSPTSPQNPQNTQQGNPKPLFYAMNV